jgi:hypothetical protein
MILRKLTLAIAALFACHSFQANAAERWPSLKINDQWHALAVEKAKTPNIRRGSFDVVPYRPDGPFLGWQLLNPGKYEKDSDTIKIDADGLPLTKYRGQFEYSPLMLIQFALKRYSKGRNDDLLKVSDKLINMQRSDGAFLNNFGYSDYWTAGAEYKPGQISGMTQGQALSVFGRTYKLTGNRKYLIAGNKSLRFMTVPFPKGPMTTLTDIDPSLSKYSFIAEYPNRPQCYTLNGYIFSLIGLYDWWKLTDSRLAHRMFNDGTRTLEKIVPYYDIGAMSAYDICHITRTIAEPFLTIPPLIIPGYQGFHVELLAVMHQLTGKTVFEDYARRFYRQTQPTEPRPTGD